MDQQIEELVQQIPPLRDKPVVMTSLSGGITNRNYRLDTDGESYVLRISGEGTDVLGINRNHEYICALSAAQQGVGPEVIAFLPEYGSLVTRFVQGRVLAPDDLQDEHILARVVASLQKWHNGPTIPGAFSPFVIVRQYYTLAQEHGVSFPPTIDQAMELVDQIEALVRSDEMPCPCHNDLLPSNFIDDDKRVWIIDWEYAAMGERFFDLGNLAANHCFTEVQERLLLELYFGRVNRDDLHRLRLMRLVSDMREALWGFLQAGISNLNFDFMSYGCRHLDRFLAYSARLKPSLVESVR
jgi:thiamine kinase-like enzyme